MKHLQTSALSLGVMAEYSLGDMEFYRAPLLPVRNSAGAVVAYVVEGTAEADLVLEYLNAHAEITEAEQKGWLPSRRGA